MKIRPFRIIMINLNHAVEVNMVFDVRSLIRNEILIFPMKTPNFQKKKRSPNENLSLSQKNRN